MGQAGLIVSLDAQHDLILSLRQPGGAGYPNLGRPGHRRYEQQTGARLVRLPPRINVFQVGPGLSQRRQLLGNTSSLVPNFARPDMNAIQLESHDGGLLAWVTSFRLYTHFRARLRPVGVSSANRSDDLGQEFVD